MPSKQLWRNKGTRHTLPYLATEFVLASPFLTSGRDLRAETQGFRLANPKPVLPFVKLEALEKTRVPGTPHDKLWRNQGTRHTLAFVKL